MTTTTIEHLEKKIDDLIRAHIADVRRKAAAAVERAFATAAVKPTLRPAVRRPPSRRRGGDEIKELAARLYKAVCADPGATMTTLARSMGSKPHEFEHPAKLLKRTGKVRSVGERNATRYFPLASKGG